MKYLPYGHTHSTTLLTWMWGLLRQRAAAVLPPLGRRLILLSRSDRARRVVALVMLLVGLMIQVVIVLVVMYLIDLSISLMELWAELARKHLELTL